MLNNTAIHHQAAKVMLLFISCAVYTSQPTYTNIRLHTGACTQILHPCTVKYDLWQVTPASVFLIINREESTGVISQSPTKVMELFVVVEARKL